MKQEKRRRFLSGAIKTIGIAGTAGMLYSAYRFIAPGEVKRAIYSKGAAASAAGQPPSAGEQGGADATSAVIPIDSVLQAGSAMVAIGYVPVIVIKTGAEYKAFNATCTHLGCLVKWDAQAGEFVCPCHAGRYDAGGRPISGPPPLPLTPCKLDQEGGSLKVSVS